MTYVIFIRVALLDEPSKHPLPSEPTLKDHRVALIKGGISSLPFVGSALAEEMGLLLITPLARRRDEWWADVARWLHEVEGRVDGFRIEDLGSNENFVSAMVQATQSATKTRRKEKLEALRNAVLNVALGHSPAGDLQAIFLNLVDSFTPVRLEVLRYLQHRNDFDLRRFRTEQYVSDQATMDLASRGLILDTRPYAARGRDSDEALVYYDWQVSDLGKRFVDLISDPPELSGK
jgi:hypothetical protein